MSFTLAELKSSIQEYTDNGVGVDSLCKKLQDSFQSEYEEIQNMLRSCANNPDKITIERLLLKNKFFALDFRSDIRLSNPTE